ncbi:MAG: T9SS type A sorting domain-containing protein [Bacteroidota bacterium]
MQKFYALVLLFLGGPLTLCAQNGLVGTGFSTGWTVPNDNVSFSASAGTSRILITQANGSGNQFFRLVRNAGDSEFYQNGQFGPIGCTTDTDVTPTEGAVNTTEGCGFTAFFIDVTDETDNYVFKTPWEFEPDPTFIYFKIEGPVKSFMSASTAQVPVPDANNFVPADETVTVSNLLGAEGLSPGHAAYLRFTTDGFMTSTVLKMEPFALPGFYSADIPPQPDGTTVEYYLFTSGEAVEPAADGTDADYRTINLENNNGNNYFYITNRALPVTYASWQGRRVKANTVQLDWSTASEDEAASFTVERSHDGGVEWTDLTLISAKNLAEGAQYAYLDEAAPMGELKYRLRQTDFDGTNHFSAIISIEGTAAELRVWPQPATQVVHVLVPGHLNGTTAQLLDLTGRVQHQLSLLEGQQTISVGDLPPGVYLLRTSGLPARRIVVR